MKEKENNSNEESLNNTGEYLENITGSDFKTMFNDFYKKIDGRVKSISDEIKINLIPKAEKKLKENIFSTVLIALGIGFILGTLVMLFGFLNGKKR